MTMSTHASETHLSGPPAVGFSRRRFLSGTLAAAATTSSLGVWPSLAAEAPEAKPAEFKRKIKLGVIGCGGRGGWIAKLFQRHGGYEMHAVADYFQEVADKSGDALGVDKARRFSTLSGYRKVIESGVEAVALETPPYFFPGHAKAAAEAGLHVYMAKPVAVDVPGCLQIEATGKLAGQKHRCFQVDYQMPTDPGNTEVLQRIRGPGFGKISHGDSRDVCSVVFEYADGLVHNHFGQALGNQSTGELSCRVHGQTGHALVNYWGKAQFRTSDDAFNGEVANLYDAGAERNIAAFYRCVTDGRFDNPTVKRAVDGALTCILGREAAARHARLTMDELSKENKRLEVDLRGLKT